MRRRPFGSRRRQPVGIALMLMAVGAVVFVLAGPPARADAPQQTGWWWTGNQGAVPEVGAPIPNQPPPDVTGKQLLVEGGSDTVKGTASPTCTAGAPVGAACSPTAFAALVFELTDGETASTLTLTAAQAPGGGASDATPDTTLQLCALTNPAIQSEYGGPMSDAPPYDCTHSVSTTDDGAGHFKFDVSNLVTDSSLAVAILPTAPSDRVVFEDPDSSSLASQQSLTASSDTSDTSGFDTSGVASDGGSSSIDSSASPIDTGSAFPAASSSPISGDTSASPALSQTPTPSTAAPASNGSTNQNLAASAYPSSPKSGGASAAAVGLIIAGILGGGGLWAYAGSVRRDPEEA